MHEMWRRARPFARAGMIVGGLALAAAIALLFGLFVMWLWNWLMPELFGFKALTYWQAWGLVVLAHILFKGGTGHEGHRPPWRRKLHERFERPSDEGAPSGTA